VLYDLIEITKSSSLISKGILKQLKKPKPTDSLCRVGATLTFRYCQAKGFKLMLGPWIFYLPSKQWLDRLLPFIFTTPAAAIATLNQFIFINYYCLIKIKILIIF
jgi:hypothetical protein